MKGAEPTPSPPEECPTAPPLARLRDPEGTRERLIHAAFELMHRHGFRSAGLTAILDDAGVTKGALYHHFGSKDELGLAVLDEVVRPMVLDHFLTPIEASDDPVAALAELVRATTGSATPEMLELGCPLNNLAQEMSSVDERFRRRLAGIFSEWRSRLAACLERGQAAGTVRSDVAPQSAATFIVAAWEGIVSLAKSSRDLDVVDQSAGGFLAFVASLRPDS